MKCQCDVQAFDGNIPCDREPTQEDFLCDACRKAKQEGYSHVIMTPLNDISKAKHLYTTKATFTEEQVDDRRQARSQ